jgi:hypothetical protein
MLPSSVSGSITNVVLQHPLLGRILNAVEIRTSEEDSIQWRLRQQRELMLEVPVNIKVVPADQLVKAVQELSRFLSNQDQQASQINYPTSTLVHFNLQWDTLTYSQQSIVIQYFKKTITPFENHTETEEKELEILGFSREQFEIAEIPPLPWQLVLRRFVQSQIGNRTRHTNHRVSQRYGTAPGIRRMRERKLGLAIDTSGSIPASLLDAFYQEVRKIHQYQGYLPIVEFDHRIQRSYLYQPGRISTPKGGGGTLFDPPLRWAQDQKLQAVIVFTDGQAAPPKVPFGKEVLWVVYGEPPVWMSECLVINF